MSIQEINWGNFRAKFDKKEQESFEWLCYMLFCIEYKRDTGISRYKNQAGIETDPIEIDGNYIGWQAKYYDTRLSEHKKDFINSIDTATKRYTKINKIVFYTNQDFSQGKTKNDPEYKTKIEEHAQSKKVEIIWRTASFFESPFVCKENADIAQHFFSFEKSRFHFINELAQHTKSILKSIRSEITFNGNNLKIDRSKSIEIIKNTLDNSSLVILSGEAGVGKTAIIKDLYDNSENLLVFKATEFHKISSLNQLFNNYGNFTVSDFINFHENVSGKLIVIDSAEKLSDLEYQEVFQEFLSTLLDSNWKIIFTTRYSYLNEIIQFIEVYKCKFESLNIKNLTDKELIDFSKKYEFNLPDNGRLHKLIHTPFYLNEYLQNYKDLDTTIDYPKFKNKLWDNQIKKTSYQKNNIHNKREDCFIEIAQKRANEGSFFVKTDNCEDEILRLLEAGEIIQYDSNTGGYFITHDIYEEWALEKIITRAFHQAKNYKKFFENIRSSLPIRSAFRSWLSEKLFINNNEVKTLIEETITDDGIESYWQDEIIVSVLLSDYSNNFFQLFECKLLENNQALLLRIVFLLRLACKEINEKFLNRLGFSKREAFSIFTIPKGKGWDCAISFINKHQEQIGSKHINTILPLLDDWNNNNKQGETTKNVSQIALFYYDEMIRNDNFRKNSLNIIKVILNGSFEIKAELIKIFDEVVSKKATDPETKYYALIRIVLSSANDSYEIAKNLPDQVIRLADLFWFQISNETNRHSRDNRKEERRGIAQYFGLSEYLDGFYFPTERLDYSPASAFQTPIFQLLRFYNKKTIDFILNFTNKTIECYLKSEFKEDTMEIKVFIDKTKSITQYINGSLWEMYRGLGDSPVLLQSIHMALEKWLLEEARSASNEVIENCCKYLIENSKSASITAVVTSVVLSQPAKLVNIATILFKTKEFFFYDHWRMIHDQTNPRTRMGDSFIDYSSDSLFQHERIKTDKDEHRRNSLKELAVSYQINKKAAIIEEILDEYYAQLPEKSQETIEDKNWRLDLTGMDVRKMRRTTEQRNGQNWVKFTPEIDPEEQYITDKYLSESFKYLSLDLWSKGRFEKNENQYKNIPQYDNDPQLVISIVKEIKENVDQRYRPVPAYACSVLIRDFFDKLTEEERKYCENVIIEYASIPLHNRVYSFQFDGLKPSIVTLFDLIKLFPKDKDKPKRLLVSLLLLNYLDYEISIFTIKSISNYLWNISFNDAQSIFLGYLLLKPKYEDFISNIVNSSEEQILNDFLEKHQNELTRIIANEIQDNELRNRHQLDLKILQIAFEMLPSRIENEYHKKFLDEVFPILAKNILTTNSSKIDPNRILEKSAYFILNCSKHEIQKYIQPFIDNFTKKVAYFFEKLILVEDLINRYEEFWIIWNIFYDKVIELGKDNNAYQHTKEIVNSYLLVSLKSDVKEWHTLKEKEKFFFKQIVTDIGEHPSVLYSTSKILYGIGSRFIEDGINWLSSILQKNPKCTEKLKETIYYIENIIRWFILKNRKKIRTNKETKNDVIIILNFLVEQGSVTGYLLREGIL